MSLTQQILKLAYEARDEALKPDSRVSSILRKCYTICQMLKREVEWIQLELFGYGDKYKTIGELREGVPEYRRVKLMYKDVYGRPILMQPEQDSLTDYGIGLSIGQIEDSTHHGLSLVGGITDYLRKESKIPILSASISDIAIKGIVESVRNKTLEFLNNVILELEYGNIISNIFEETKRFVDSKLVEICPLVLDKLNNTYKNLVDGSASLTWSQIAFACRDILQDFTDSIYKPDYLPNGEAPPKREQTKRKLRLTFQAIAPKPKTERELVESQVDYLLKYFDKLTDLIQKYVHAKKYEISKEDANRCVICTYLVIGDILKLLKSK